VQNPSTYSYGSTVRRVVEEPKVEYRTDNQTGSNGYAYGSTVRRVYEEPKVDAKVEYKTDSQTYSSNENYSYGGFNSVLKAMHDRQEQVEK
jgi:hypothetical protein